MKTLTAGLIAQDYIAAVDQDFGYKWVSMNHLHTQIYKQRAQV